MKRPGFTLTEILMVIAIVSIFIVVSIPILSGAFRKRNDIKDLSNLRQCMIDFSFYASDNKNRFVNAGPPGRVSSELYYGIGATDEQVMNSYGGQVASWPNVLFLWSRTGERHWHSAYEQLPDPSEVGDAWDSYLGGGWTNVHYINASKYWYSMTMITKASAWTKTGVRGDRAEIAARYFDFITYSQISHPSSKAVLIQIDRPGSTNLKHYAFADGSVSLNDEQNAKPTAVPLESNGSTPGAPGLSTLDGHKGRDF